ncbi:MAG: glycosyltransferase [Acidimicrobiia bacterium]|nr:glycosyltransferase [Acidimicrobiia bacterium]
MRILQITNHGLHEWQVTPGLPDTGGQNVYVNQLTAALVRLGHEVTIVNRGGYPHPLTGEMRTGAVPATEGNARIVYLEDTVPSFVRKEDMAEVLPELAAALTALLRKQTFDLILSHYWDGGLLGVLANAQQTDPVAHLWIPHSLGAIKRRNTDAARWPDLRIDERIAAEHDVVTAVDGVVATSVTIRASARDDYGTEAKYFLPPGVDPDRFRVRPAAECQQVWSLLAEHTGRSVDQLQGRPLILEVSRTDTTKRKDVLLRAFAAVVDRSPRPVLAVTIDQTDRDLHRSLLELIVHLGVQDDVAVLGSVWDWLPCLYSEAAIYCTPSIMEGFGMSAQEAAATATPVVASDRVPFATEYLLGSETTSREVAGAAPLTVGAGGIVVPADSIAGFAAALALLLSDDELRGRQGEAAHRITIPAFAWDGLATAFLDQLRDHG